MKIFSFDNLSAWADSQKSQGLTIAHCHGVFDLLHPGHLTHLREARALADKLVVTVTSDRHVNKGPGRPVIDELGRATMLAALEMVDAVTISDYPSGLSAIKAIRPDFYVKGPDYKNPSLDLTGNMQLEIDATESAGGSLYLTSGPTMSSSKIRNDMLLSGEEVGSRFLARLRESISEEIVDRMFFEISKLKVLVIGEAILDTYESCEALGKSSKDPVLAFRKLASESQLGGSLAIARHVAGMGARTTLMTRVGKGDGTKDRLEFEIGSSVDLIVLESEDEPTIEKTRFVDVLTGNKVFETYEIGDSRASIRDSENLNAALSKVVEDFDLVLVADYGHGLLDAHAIRLLSSKARKLSVNTQSNAGNRGFNSISKYPRVDIVCLNGGEVALELRERHLSMEVLVPELLERTGAELVAVTSGANGLVLGLTASGTPEVEVVPAFTTKVKDRVGAGDALFAATSVSWVASRNPLLAAVLGNLSGAASIAELGNRVALDKVSLQRHLTAMLK
jgi:rfaE bifunctional protein nucleotidyltransferase chain/domain